jgi:hypothetical protein
MPAARSRTASRARVRGAREPAGRCGAAGGKNVETPHLVETSHAYRVFYFRWMQSFHAVGDQAPMAGLLSAESAHVGYTDGYRSKPRGERWVDC